MPEPIVISCSKVSKSYTLYPSPRAVVADLLGYYRLFPGRKPKSFQALNEVDFEIRKGERVGIIGRNGAGKSTLLKMLTGNFPPTSGRVEVAGIVHSLMDAGVGFHPEFTGRENITASLLYNGISRADTEAAIQDIASFVELDAFLDQPIKTYSLGMVARLGFATATAIKPDLLVIDEVLGAGDAYFMAKSAERIRNLTSNGATLVLVSHSLEQVLRFCTRVLWIEGGRVIRDGDGLEVVKEYQAFIRNMDEHRILEANAGRQVQGKRTVSHWKGIGGLHIDGVRMLNAEGKDAAIFRGGDPLAFEIRYTAERDGEFPCRYHVYIYTLDGVRLVNHLSEVENVRLRAGESRTVRLEYDRLMLGNGDFVFSSGIYKSISLDKPGPVEFYDMLDRSYQFRVHTDQPEDTCLVHHESRWSSGADRTMLRDTVGAGHR